MKKIGAVIVLMLASVSAYAGSSSQQSSNEQNHGIVTPEVATSMWRTTRFVHDTKNMNILICQLKYEYTYRNDTCEDKNKKNAWVKMENAVPQGTKFVGFKSVSQGSTQYIEIYWKQVKQ